MLNDQKRKTDARRFETPSMSGYRSGMTISRVIAGKLGSLYNPPAEIPGEMHDLIQAIDVKTCRVP